MSTAAREQVESFSHRITQRNPQDARTGPLKTLTAAEAALLARQDQFKMDFEQVRRVVNSRIRMAVDQQRVVIPSPFLACEDPKWDSIEAKVPDEVRVRVVEHFREVGYVIDEGANVWDVVIRLPEVGE